VRTWSRSSVQLTGRLGYRSMMGEMVNVVLTKWGQHPHWQFGTERLGQDEHGVWLGARAGRQMSRPGESVTLDYDSVMVVPPRQPYVATFNAARHRARSECAIYVDITTPAQWYDNDVTMVDLDLDVVVGWDGSVFVDDEDEFRDHQSLYAYPDDVIEMARRSCDSMLAAVQSVEEPFRTVGRRWLTRMNRPPR
jgi:uncharacterized protein